MKFLKKHWRKINLNRVAAGTPAAMERLYLLDDPWGLDNPAEHHRFSETNRLIAEQFDPPLGDLLEIGCGEGLQSRYLSKLAGRIVGLEPSRRAANRALALDIPNFSAVVGGLLEYENPGASPFDIVVACEVIYYFDDPGEVIARMEALGRYCVVTYHQSKWALIDPFVEAKDPDRQIIEHGSCKWKFASWTSPAHGAG